MHYKVYVVFNHNDFKGVVKVEADNIEAACSKVSKKKSVKRVRFAVKDTEKGKK